MRARETIPIVLLSLASVSEARGGLIGPHRRIYPDFLGKCPASYQGTPIDELSRMSLQQLQEMIKGQTNVPAGLSGPPCLGVPVDEASVQRLRPGSSCPVKWSVEQPSAEHKCKITLMCPGKRTDQVLWSGDCGSRAGETEVKVELPADLKQCGMGECFLQWRMDTAHKQTYCDCMDIVVDGEAPAEGEGAGTGTGTAAGAGVDVDVGAGSGSGAECTTGQPTQPDQPDSPPTEQPEGPEAPLPTTVTEAATITSTEISTMTVTETLPPQTMTSTETTTITETTTLPVTVTSIQPMPTTVTIVTTEIVPNGTKTTPPAAPTLARPSISPLGYGQTVATQELPANPLEIEHESTSAGVAGGAAYPTGAPLITARY